jgi:hypothetical protein
MVQNNASTREHCINAVKVLKFHRLFHPSCGKTIAAYWNEVGLIRCGGVSLRSEDSSVDSVRQPLLGLATSLVAAFSFAPTARRQIAYPTSSRGTGR